MNHINVHLSMPTSPDKLKCTWVHSLKIPLQDLMPLSRRPFKHIRYICFSLLSARGELSLSKQKSPIHPVAYDSATVDIPPNGILNVYYHIKTDERRDTFPLDPEIERLTVTTSSQYSRQPDFRGLVSEKDGATCVATGCGMRFCEAAHLIAVSKGNDYIRILTENRSKNHTEQICIEEINDIRNGLLLSKMIHDHLGKLVGFLPLPNIYMTHEDVDTPPADKSFILHDLTSESQLQSQQRTILPQFNTLRIASENWPPDILFDVVYASAVLKVWGADYASFVTPEWTKRFYGGTPVPTHGGRLQQKQSDDREARHARRSGRQATEPDTLDLLMTMYYLVHGDGAETPDRLETPDKQDTSQCAESVQSKVQEWLGMSRDSEFEAGFA